MKNKFYLLAAFLIGTVYSFADMPSSPPVDPGDNTVPPGHPDGDPVDANIDSAIMFLVVAGLLLGTYMVAKNMRKVRS